MDVLRKFGVLLAAVYLSGCAMMPAPGEKARDALLSGGVAPAKQALESELATDEKNKLLYLMNGAVLQHLSGDYAESNRSLSEAAQLAEVLQTKRAQDLVAAALTNPEVSPYSGTVYEHVFIHYYMALNYLALADRADGDANRKDMLEGARIQARKVDILLSALNSEKGTYDEVEEGDKGFFKKLMNVFRTLEGRKHDPDWLVYREDAYIRYMEGLVYESNKEYNEARIAYQKAASLYEKGYAKQYLLGQDIVEQAWIDVIRMMKKAGGYESDWPALVGSKLTQEGKQRLEALEAGQAQIVVVSHMDMIPQREELSFYMRLDKITQELILSPVYSSDPVVKRAQQNWFNDMYSDRGLLAVVTNYHDGGVVSAVDGLFSKRINMAPVWELLSSAPGLVDILAVGSRVAVPYYNFSNMPFGETAVTINGESAGRLLDAESIGLIALQEQLLSASSELHESIAREVLKQFTCVNTAGKAAPILCTIGNAATSGAETRNWLNLPSAVRIQRFPVDGGDHAVKVVTQGANGGVFHQADEMVSVEKGGLHVLRTRALN